MSKFNPSSRHLELFTMLKSGKSVTVEAMQTALKIKSNSIMVLVYQLRTHLGGDIDSERDGRKVVSYRLNNASALESKLANVKTGRKPKAAKTPKVAVLKTKTKVSKPKATAADDSIPTLDVEEVGDDELASLKAELGLTDSYAE